MYCAWIQSLLTHMFTRLIRYAACNELDVELIKMTVEIHFNTVATKGARYVCGNASDDPLFSAIEYIPTYNSGV
jgi:hypothetical protein